MENVGTFIPSPTLSPFVRYYWMLKMSSGGTAISERTVPTGCLSLVFHRSSRGLSSSGLLQPRSFICGLSDSFYELAFGGDVDMIVIVFQPYGAKALLGIPAEKFSGLEVSVSDLGDNTWMALEQKLWETSDDRRCIGHIEEFLIERLRQFDRYDFNRIVAAVKEVSLNPDATVRDISGVACVSERQLNRVFTDAVGATPKEFIRIIRFQRALHLMSAPKFAGMAQIASAAGYFDQSHMIREFKRLSGYTPAEYQSACQPYSDYFSTFR